MFGSLHCGKVLPLVSLPLCQRAFIWRSYSISGCREDSGCCAGSQYCVVMEASGLRPGDVDLSVADDRMHVLVDVRMRQFERLLKALGASTSDVVGGVDALPKHNNFRVTLPLPRAVAVPVQNTPLAVEDFFMWYLDIA